MAAEMGIKYREVRLETGVCFPMGKDGTYWRVLDIDREAKTALVIADLPVRKRAYHDKSENVTWEKCSLRAWLNGEWFEKTFSDEEKVAILTTHVDNSRAQGYRGWHTNGGNDTDDRIFLLSYAEAWKYFRDNADRQADGEWWLRSPGDIRRCAAYVIDDGSLGSSSVDRGSRSVRPAFKVDLGSGRLKDMFVFDTEDGWKLRQPVIDVPCTETVLENDVSFLMGNGGTYWRVLDIDREAKTALVIADLHVRNRAYHDKIENVTWEKCSLRAWLNGEWFEKTFSDEEKVAILTTHVDNSRAQGYSGWHTDGGNDTDDRIFLLSYAEAWKYFRDNADRQADGWWWLRSPADIWGCAAYVTDDGSLGSHIVDRGYGYVRPAFKVDLGSDWFKSMIVSETRNEWRLRIPDMVLRGSRLRSIQKNLKKLVTPDGVTDIGANALAGNKNLCEIILPSSFKLISEGVFEECKSLTSINIPGSVTEIGERAFSWCRSLTSINIPESVTEIGWGAFKNCWSLTSIEIPGSVTKIGESVFEGCRSLKSIKIPESVTEIGWCAFEECESLTSINIPESVTEIGRRAFSKCKSLTSIEIPESVTVIGDGALTDNGDHMRIVTHVKLKKAMFGEIKEQGAIYTNDPGLLPNEMKVRTMIGYGEEPDEPGSEREKVHLKYIKANAQKLIPEALEHLPLLRVMLKNRVLTPAQTEACLTAAQNARNTEAITMMLEYKDNYYTAEERSAHEKKKKKGGRQGIRTGYRKNGARGDRGTGVRRGEGYTR